MVIPGNDDAIRSIRLVTKIIADSCARGLESSKGFSPKGDSESPVIQTIKKEETVVEEISSEDLVNEKATLEETVVEEVSSEEVAEVEKNDVDVASSEVPTEEKETEKDDK
jgi:small subunit ribosomal protein S2